MTLNLDMRKSNGSQPYPTLESQKMSGHRELEKEKKTVS